VLRTCVILLILCLGVWPEAAESVDIGVVFGSFVNRHNADARRLRLRSNPGIETVVVEAEVNGRRFFRVMAIAPGPSEALELRQQGIKEGLYSWLINLPESSYASEVAAERRRQGKRP